MHQGAAIKRRPALVHCLSALAAPYCPYLHRLRPDPFIIPTGLLFGCAVASQDERAFCGKPFNLRYFMVKGRAEGAFPVKFRFCSFA